MPERWFFSCSGRPSWVETGRIKHFGWVCVWICICVQRETDIKQLITAVCFLCFGFNPVWDSPPLTLIPAFHSTLLKIAGFWLFQFVLRIKKRVGRWVFVLWMIISLTKIQVQGKLHQHFSRLQTWHLILFFFFWFCTQNEKFAILERKSLNLLGNPLIHKVRGLCFIFFSSVSFWIRFSLANLKRLEKRSLKMSSWVQMIFMK